METKELLVPDVEKISGLITSLQDYAVRNAREQWAQKMSSEYRTPRLRCWDECAWIELAKDREVVDYLLSDLTGAWILMRSLHFCLHWYGQAEIDRLQKMGVAIGSE